MNRLKAYNKRCMLGEQNMNIFYALPKSRQPKIQAVEESKGSKTLPLHELIGFFSNKNGDDEKVRKVNVLNANEHSSNDEFSLGE